MNARFDFHLFIRFLCSGNNVLYKLDETIYTLV